MGSQMRRLLDKKDEETGRFESSSLDVLILREMEIDSAQMRRVRMYSTSPVLDKGE